MKNFYVLCFCMLLPALAVAQNDSKTDDAWKFFGQAQIRTELDGRDFLDKTFPQSFSCMRLRFGAEKSFLKDIDFKISLQDARVLGEENSTIVNLKNIDLYEGYVKVNNIFQQPLSVQAGRFEMSYGSTRIIGSNQWNYRARAFDGVRAKYQMEHCYVDVFSVIQNKFTDYYSGATPSQYVYPEASDSSYNIYGLWSSFDINYNNKIDAFAYYDANRKKSDKKDWDLSRYTGGLEYNFKYDNISLLLSGAYQCGTAKKLDVNAYRAAFEFKYTMNAVGIILGTDILSGTSADNETKKRRTTTFSNDFAGKHAFFGYMNYFSDIVKSTANRGINDFWLRAEYSAKSSPWYGELTYHYMMTNQDYRIVKSIGYDEKNNLGNEIDLVLRYNIAKVANLEGGVCAFMPEDVMKAIWQLNNIKREDMAFYSYLMLKVNI